MVKKIFILILWKYLHSFAVIIVTYKPEIYHKIIQVLDGHWLKTLSFFVLSVILYSANAIQTNENGDLLWSSESVRL